MTPVAALGATLAAATPYAVPVDLGRQEAQQLAERELADPVYHLDDPSLLERVVQWVLDRVGEGLDLASGVVPGGPWGLLVVVATAVAVVALVVWRSGGVRRSGATLTPLFTGRPMSAADHRRLADRAAASGRWEEATRERYRAIVRSLEERTILDERPGRTADEAAGEAGLLLPTVATDLAAAASTFDAVVYGGRPASSTDDRFLRELDRAVGEIRPRAYATGARL